LIGWSLEGDGVIEKVYDGLDCFFGKRVLKKVGKWVLHSRQIVDMVIFAFTLWKSLESILSLGTFELIQKIDIRRDYNDLMTNSERNVLRHTTDVIITQL